MNRLMMAVMVVALAGFLLGGCGGGAGSRRDAAEYVLLYLKTGPNSASLTPDQSKEVFGGHMANMKRLADEKKLVIAGPFARPRDKTWRGIFVLNTGSMEEAKAWAASDPGVIAGAFVTEMRAMSASPALRQTLELEKALPAAKEAKPGDPPPNIRAYVMVTSDDAEWTNAAIARSSMAGKVVWCGLFPESARGQTRGGVFVIDAAKADEVGEALAAADSGPVGVDGWWSTISLMKLPEDARKLP